MVRPGRPGPPTTIGRKPYVRYGNGDHTRPCNDFFPAIMASIMLLLQIQVYNAIGYWWTYFANAGQYRIPHRIRDRTVYDDAPQDYAEVETYTDAQWNALSAFYDFDWDTREMADGTPMNIQCKRAEWCQYAGIMGFFAIVTFEWPR
ncbi:hypothetical protein BJ508DRAFT_329594 [Ascobolus immersus RN42]|uniref:Uncharacterized protein n=1 Tax=Ascobolus immersus RN42 TaxID=1160509 RepID=A0A3N4I1I0_ASCIM|nr:hypothetical protein BJ508DRAFT_329594 [Ascobolus immersus RN42]